MADNYTDDRKLLPALPQKKTGESKFINPTDFGKMIIIVPDSHLLISLLGGDMIPTAFKEFRKSPVEKDSQETASSPMREAYSSQSQTYSLDPNSQLSLADKDEMDLMSNMAAVAGITDIEAIKRNMDKLKDGEERCRLCQCTLQKEFVDAWRKKTGSNVIRLSMWTEIHEAHIRKSRDDEWRAKGYPENIEWERLAERAKKHLGYLEDIVSGQAKSKYRDLFARQMKDTKGNAARLLRQEHTLPHPGYYGPRGADIMQVPIVYGSDAYDANVSLQLASDHVKDGKTR